MGQVLSYLIESSVLMFLLWIVYRWLLSDANQPVYNRKVLLAIYAAAISMPMFIPVFSFNRGAIDLIGEVAEAGLPQVVGTVDETGGVTSYLPMLCVCLWLAGILIIGVITFIGVIRLRRVLRGASYCGTAGGAKMLLTDDDSIAPFSVCRYIVMSCSDYDSAGEMILSHERQHVLSRHWIDLLLGRIYAVLCWFNPAAWFMIEELRSVHEYEADRAVLASGADARQYQLLLIKKAVGRSFPTVANSLNHSKLKKRIAMMLKSKSGKSRRMRAFALVPAAALAVAVFNVPFMANALAAVSDVSVITADKVSEKSSDSAIPSAMNDDDQEKVLETAEVMPRFPGGEAALMRWLMDNIRYPADAPEGFKKKKVIVQFVIDRQGKVVNPEILRSGGEAFDREALRVVSAMPDWTPGMLDGKPVSVRFTLPITFREVSKPASKS